MTASGVAELIIAPVLTHRSLMQCTMHHMLAGKLELLQGPGIRGLTGGHPAVVPTEMCTSLWFKHWTCSLLQLPMKEKDRASARPDVLVCADGKGLECVASSTA